MMTKNLAELQKEAAKFNLEIKFTGRGGNPAKRDYIKALADHYLIERYGALDKIPKNLGYRLSYECPMLAFQYSRLKEQEQVAIWESEDWWLTEKENGVRGWLIYSPSEGLSLYSRNISTTDYLPIDYAEKILNAPGKGVHNGLFCIDVEVKCTNPNIRTFLRDAKGVETETELQAVAALLAINTKDSLDIQMTQALDEPLFEFKVIDVLYWNKKDWRKDKYIDRAKNIEPAIAQAKSMGLNIKPIKSCKIPAEKKAFHAGILNEGGEGTIAVNINTSYNGTPNRHRDEWIKIKRSVSESAQMEGLGDTIDGYITGFEEADEGKGWAGLIGALKVSVMLQKKDGTETEHMIARVTNIQLSLRKLISIKDKDGNLAMKEEMYDRVLEIDGQVLSAVSSS